MEEQTLKPEYIKPIPKYVEKKILLLDRKRCPENKGLRFYAYLTAIKKELVKITVAVRNKGKKLRLIKQVAVHGVYSDKCLVRDLEYCYLGIYAYRVGWFDEGIKYAYNIRPNYNDGVWYAVDYKYYNPYAEVINKELALKLFPYSAVNLLENPYVISYLRTYIKYPQTEYLLKLGLGKFVYSKMLLEKIGKDKKFCKWLIANKNELLNNRFYIAVILRAYQLNKPLQQLQDYAEAKIQLKNQNSQVRLFFKGKDLERLIDYIAEQRTNASTYHDYYLACRNLGLDMSADKNRFPHNFKRWHDIRIDEYATMRAMQDAERKKELYTKFAAVAQKYISLQHNIGDSFVVIIAKSPAELIHEGDTLHHCVGRMNYDQKFAREETLIFFVRNITQPNVPFVTLEYSIQNKKILQCYGDRDSKPDDSVLEFVNKKWLPYANRQIKQIAA